MGELGWRPADFWQATPAELAALAAYLRDRASGLDEESVQALRAALISQKETEDGT